MPLWLFHRRKHWQFLEYFPTGPSPQNTIRWQWVYMPLLLLPPPPLFLRRYPPHLFYPSRGSRTFFQVFRSVFERRIWISWWSLWLILTRWSTSHQPSCPPVWWCTPRPRNSSKPGHQPNSSSRSYPSCSASAHFPRGSRTSSSSWKRSATRSSWTTSGPSPTKFLRSPLQLRPPWACCTSVPALQNSPEGNDEISFNW